VDKNRLYYGDNLDILRNHIPDESVDLIYLDPPFNSNRNYNVIYDSTAQAEAFKDTWSIQGWQDESHLIFEDEAQRYSSIHYVIEAMRILLLNSNPALFGYLVMMAIRLVELYRVLKPTGSIYLHCDPTASHYLKIVLDAVFGPENFKNEIVWKRSTAHNMETKGYTRVNDVLLFFTKTGDYTFNELYTPYSDAQLSRYKKDKDGRLYKAENLTFSTPNPSRQFEWRGSKPPANRSWGASLEQLEKWWNEGRILKKRNGSPRLDGLLIYLDETKGGSPLDTFWGDINRIGNTSKERLGYPTQKPEALLERIVGVSSNVGDLVLDPFCGCGTTIAAAQKLKRRWIGIDITFLAIDLIRQRLLDHYYRGETGLNEPDARKQFDAEIEIFGIPRDLEGARQLATKTPGDRVRKEFEKWAVFSVGGVYSEVKGADMGMDGYFILYDVDDDNKSKRVQCPIQVKSGHVGAKDIRDFIHVIDREHALLGIFITLEGATRPMKAEIAKEPKARLKIGQEYDKVIIVQVQDIIDGKLPNLPIQRATKRAGRTVKNGQRKLFNEET